MAFSSALLCVVAAVAVATDPWEDFKRAYGRTFNGPDEEAVRRAAFEANIAFIDAENAKDHTYTLGVNQFADITNDEFKSFMGFKPPTLPEAPRFREHTYNGEPLADSLDWTTRGAVTPVKDQGQCGSCWAFSTTGGIEGTWQVTSGSLVSVSEQQLVDCNRLNGGCQGGSMDLAFMYLERVNICTETSYPYQGVDGSCTASDCVTGIPQNSVTGYQDVTANNADAFMSALQSRPLSIAIEADQLAFQHYSSGIIDEFCGTNLDHGVLAVGYGDLDGQPYWKMKNSWGVSWGMQGYGLITRSVQSSPAGMCGILSQPSYPVMTTSVLV